MSTNIEYNDDIIETHTASWSAEQIAQYSDYISNQRLDYEPTIQSGDRLVIESGEKMLIVHIKPNTTIPIRNKQVKIEALIGQPLNGTYSYENNTLKRRLDGKVDIEAVFSQVEEKELDKDFMPINTNKNLISRQENQKMKSDEIESLKDSGLSGADIIKQVAAGSSTWDGKTEFSQLKWLKKKWAKYSTDISTYQSTAFNLKKLTGGHVFEETRQVDHLRDDAIAQMLAMANIGYGMRCIVVDSTDGLVSGAAQRRMGDSGATMYVHAGKNSQQGVLDLNLNQNERQRIITMPIDALPSYGWAGDIIGWNQYQREKIAKCKLDMKSKYPHPTEIVYPLMTNHAQNFLQHKALSAIICHWNYDPLSLLLPILPHLLPSSPIVLWSATIEPLVTAMHFLQTHSLATQLHLQDTWFRPLQVLPNRTHPNMNMDATGGFLLYGFTLDVSIPVIKPKVGNGPIDNIDDINHNNTNNNNNNKNESFLHPQFQQSNDAINFSFLVSDRFKNSAQNNQKSKDANPKDGQGVRIEKQEMNKRKWQPKDKEDKDDKLQ